MHAAAAFLPRLAVTAGEPAGIGPELVARLAMQPLPADLIAIGDADQLRRAAAHCGLTLQITDDDGQRIAERQPGQIRVAHHPLRTPEQPGQPDPRNAFQVLNTLSHAADGCMSGEFDAVVTAPVQKSIINDAGEPFSGHTEFFARRANASVVMMLASEGGAERPPLRVALATTHLPLRAVPDALDVDMLCAKLRIVHDALQRQFGIAEPRIGVLGLNPHAGEGGHMGREEIDIIEPAMQILREQGLHLLGPLPADTAFVPAMRPRMDAVLAMYHDQALPVLKSEAFDSTVNLTLGLPFVRTSVDHGTALELAGSGQADPSSLIAAARLALRLIPHARSPQT
ncbi:4-hydroxythreonine-4-phosphate dehydrogenase PdxA [Oleiagrimonas sp. MCCC 1A03011]|uniref:4-hydroxythreonine-4-phosphate dehydrogenase PdxA n=1 Tax=Oleiagrimonas sp. MCCC 1A03011 TaxID=1926883 RepID=UPI000DC25E1C|nr:4-hydroxythreonine-4-phosphate dehydrogenase PdxA [Oleiagrimonas sp. MCCC 1A03011]RAP59506.1 4-hydroxythreonine-4-phosphate dehydrogenase PdxA [Oleiagrimonas sp. MCCC 1A03011]